MFSVALTGALASLALIVAIGAQNAFVLRQGIRRQYVWTVVAICAAVDTALILAGIAGVGAVVERAPAVLDVVRWFGVVFLVAYGLLALRRALHPAALEAADHASSSRRTTILQTLALTLLNPHVYLDTVLLIGSLANQHGTTDRWWFGGGAALASIGWFVSLGAGARAASTWFASPRAWRFIDVAVALTMFAVAAMLAFD